MRRGFIVLSGDPERPGTSETALDIKKRCHSAPPAPFYRNYVLTILLLVSTLNYVDRQIINILVEPIKSDLHLTDGQLGMITGLSFAIFYSILGIPIARLADRSHRPFIIAASIAVWSAFTFGCGLVQNFTFMLLARIGVGSGEAGGSPPAHSLISDYTTPRNRASALAVFSLGSPIGTLIGLALGGLLSEAVGWRGAFAIAAAPGLLLAAVIALTISEPRRPHHRLEGPQTSASVMAVILELRRKPSFWWLSAAAACAAFLINGHGAFYSSFFLRRYSLELKSFNAGLGPLGLVGVLLGVVRGVSGVLGTMAGGYLTDRAVTRDPRGYCSIPAICMLLGAPGFAAVLLAPNAVTASLLLSIPSFMSAAILAPTFAAVQTMVAPRARATAAAIIFFLLNIVGGLGPLAVGVVSDQVGASLGRTEGLGVAMLATCPVMLLSGFCYWMARRTITSDLTSEQLEIAG